MNQSDDFVDIINDRSLGTLESVVLGKAFVESLGRHHPEILEGIIPGIQDPKIQEISARQLEQQEPHE